MKYMGSKRWMLQNGLGTLLTIKAKECDRFIDLFSGTGSIAAFVATQYKIPCYAYDIQLFSAVLNNAVLSRSSRLDSKGIWESWINRARGTLGSVFRNRPTKPTVFSKAYVLECRVWCAERRNKVITLSYGGHYFSPEQAMWIDALRSTLPTEENERVVALASLIQASSQCAASPGHTAQPFQPTPTARKYIEDAWGKKIDERTQSILGSLCNNHARCVGGASVLDANLAVKALKEGDLAFIDPPYSGVHYSRFYHVLETIAHGFCSPVSGIGRYPRTEERPISRYSIGTKAKEALKQLLFDLWQRKVNAILTFPSHVCSNGLSGKIVRETAGEHFLVSETVVESKFSTLGGNNRKSDNGKTRSARKQAKELILYLVPKKR